MPASSIVTTGDAAGEATGDAAGVACGDALGLASGVGVGVAERADDARSASVDAVASGATMRAERESMRETAMGGVGLSMGTAVLRVTAGY
ncbi:MAG: hypothetical protein QM753_12015 [Thermomicrobiales bacterium]